MIDHLDTQTNNFLDDGIRGDCIRERSAADIFNDSVSESRYHIAEAKRRPVINIDSWGKSTPVTSIFDGAPEPESLEPESRPMTAPEQRKSDLVNRYPIIAQASLNCKEKAL